MAHLQLTIPQAEAVQRAPPFRHVHRIQLSVRPPPARGRDPALSRIRAEKQRLSPQGCVSRQGLLPRSHLPERRMHRAYQGVQVEGRCAQRRSKTREHGACRFGGRSGSWRVLWGGHCRRSVGRRRNDRLVREIWSLTGSVVRSILDER